MIHDDLRYGRDVKIIATPRENYPGLQFYCPFCKKNHLHGEGYGSRAPHCWDNGFKHDYILVRPGTKNAHKFEKGDSQ